MNDTQKRLYATALSQIEHNLELLTPGLGLTEFVEKSWPIPDRHLNFRYSSSMHGVGMADEWPVAWHPIDSDESNQTEVSIEPGMVVCLESLIGEGRSESIKLETQVLITETGTQRLDTFPWQDF